MIDILALPFAGLVLSWFGPKLPRFIRLRLRTAHWMSSDDLRDDICRLLFFVRNDLITVSSKNHRPLGAVEREAAHSGRNASGRAFMKLNDRLEAGILDDRVLHIRNFTIVLEIKSASGARDCRRTFHVHAPMHDIKRVLA